MNPLRGQDSGHNLIVFKYFQTINYADLMRTAHHQTTRLTGLRGDWCSRHVLK